MRADNILLVFVAALLCAPGEARAGGETDPAVLHAPPSRTAEGEPLRIVAIVAEEWTEAELIVRYRPAARGGRFREARFERSARGSYDAVIPAGDVRMPAVEYYIAARGGDGEAARFASADDPHRVQVTVPERERWAESERRRLHGRLSQVDASGRVLDFGNRFGHDDFFARGEIAWTHRLLTMLYSIRLGYGLIEGRTPTGPNDGRHEMAVSQRSGGRYGFGEVRLRLHRAVWVDARAAVGFDRDGFIVGGGGELTLGEPWRSSVSAGAEVFEGLRGTYWLRLQWDTVPPFLMGASIALTDLPAADVENGSYVSYDATYPITERFDLGGWLAAGTRDGPTGFGGGLSTTVRF